MNIIIGCSKFGANFENMDNQQTLSCDELEFLSEFELVEIIPRFEMDELKLCEVCLVNYKKNLHLHLKN